MSDGPFTGRQTELLLRMALSFADEHTEEQFLKAVEHGHAQSPLTDDEWAALQRRMRRASAALSIIREDQIDDPKA
jgi:hypothetical protein